MRDVYPDLMLSIISTTGKDRKRDIPIDRSSILSLIKSEDLSVQPHIARHYSSCPEKTAEEIIRRCEKHKIEIIPIHDKKYPALLNEIYKPPPVLFVKGELNQNFRFFSIVGTRKSDKKSEDITRIIASSMAGSGFTVVSGMAMGIDRYAHQSALKCAGGTLAVLPNGIDVLYPYQNRDVFEAIENSRNSALVSEFPPGIIPGQKWVFARRNRIVSGISEGVVIIKAPYKSGAMITARYAMEQNREVFACPGYAFDPDYEGCHTLIKEGAHMVTSMDDIFRELNPETLFKSEKRNTVNPGKADPVITKNPVSDPGLTGLEQKIFKLLNRDGVDIDHLIRELGERTDTVLEAVTTLQIEGVAERVGNRVFLN